MSQGAAQQARSASVDYAVAFQLIEVLRRRERKDEVSSM